MTEIDNISFKQYLELEDKYTYNYVATYSPVLNTAKDVFKIGPFNELTFGQVKDAQYKFEKGVGFENMLNFVAELLKVNIKTLAKNKFFDICKARRFIEVQLDRISKLEAQLYCQVTPIDEAAGIDKLAKFGRMIQIDALAGGDPLKYDAVENLPYEIGFAKLLLDKEREEYQVEKNRLVNKIKP